MSSDCYLVVWGFFVVMPEEGEKTKTGMIKKIQTGTFYNIKHVPYYNT